LRKLLRWIVGLPTGIAVIGFAVANRRWITLSFDPFSQVAPFAAINLPLWALAFIGTFIGILAGWLVAWLGQAKWRKLAKESRSEIARLQEELTTLRQEAERRGQQATELITFGDQNA
jgi:uncharacterized membrane protein YccC